MKRYVIVDDSEPRPALYHVQVGPAFPLRHELSADLGQAAWFLFRTGAVRRLRRMRYLGIDRPGFRIVPITVSREEVLTRLRAEASSVQDAETAAVALDCEAFLELGATV